MIRNLRRLLFNTSYLFRPPWDTGIPAPELVRYAAGKQPGTAIDIGCGTGTNLLFLAQQGWRVSGIDFAPLAIEKTRRKLKAYPKTLLAANVTQLAGLALPGPYDLALDMGCFHTLSEPDRGLYVQGLEKWIKPGGVFLLYAFQPAGNSSMPGISRATVENHFNTSFDLFNYEQGQGHPSAWYYFERK